MHNITKTIMESLEYTPAHSFPIRIKVADELKVIEEYVEYDEMKSHLLQSQLKVIDAVIDYVHTSKKSNVRVLTKVSGHELLICNSCEEISGVCRCGNYNAALEDQITHLNEVKQELNTLTHKE